jgi:hypothetical protein
MFFTDNAPLIATLALVVLTIVALGVGSEMFKRWLEHKEAMAQALNAHTAEKAAQYAAQTERLEQRMRVLERIATDKGVDLSDEIDRLRDATTVN